MKAEFSEIATDIVEDETAENDSRRFLIFEIDKLSIGVSTDFVIEIITNHAITKVPMLPSYIEGIINLRGQIIPIVNIRRRMGKPTVEFNDKMCIIVLNIESTYIGIIVDTVQQVVDINVKEISQVPVHNGQELINGMLSIGDGATLLFLDCQQLVHNF